MGGLQDFVASPEAVIQSCLLLLSRPFHQLLASPLPLSCQDPCFRASYKILQPLVAKLQSSSQLGFLLMSHGSCSIGSGEGVGSPFRTIPPRRVRPRRRGGRRGT